jgi:glucose/arabinose dehydrogenase
VSSGSPPATARHTRPAAVIAAALLGACGDTRSAGCSGAFAVPSGFCAQLFAADVGPARHLVVTAAGDVYVALWREGSRHGGVLALRDTNRDGRADVRRTFGPEAGAGLALGLDSAGRGLLFLGAWGKVYRWTLPTTGELVPARAPHVVVDGIPQLEHGARSLALGRDGSLYVNIGAPSNACERDYAARDFRGDEPCRELAASGGVWRFPGALDPAPAPVHPSQEHRFATGLRHTVALAVDPADGAVYGAPHGIDHLRAWWPAAGYTAAAAADKSAETLFRLVPGGDYGFPYCLYDSTVGRMIVAPAYGGRAGGGDARGRCAHAPPPLATFTAHAAPLALVAYRGRQFPARYRGGLFVALHGSLFRTPRAPSGYQVAFVPRLATGRFGMPERFADALPGPGLVGSRARPSGLAVGPDGSLFVADDGAGRVWRIWFRR